MCVPGDIQDTFLKIPEDFYVTSHTIIKMQVKFVMSINEHVMTSSSNLRSSLCHPTVQCTENRPTRDYIANYYKVSHEHQQNSRRFPAFPGAISNYRISRSCRHPANVDSSLRRLGPVLPLVNRFEYTRSCLVSAALRRVIRSRRRICVAFAWPIIGKTRRHPRNRKYITYRNAAGGGPSYDHTSRASNVWSRGS